MKIALLILCLATVGLAQDDRTLSPTVPSDETLPPTRLSSDGTRLPTRLPPDSTPPPPLDPSDNPDSTCSEETRCPDSDSICIERRTEDSEVIAVCQDRVTEGNACARLRFLEAAADDDDADADDDDDTERRLRQIALEMAEGARDRDTARTINGVLTEEKCTDGLSCVEDLCASRVQSLCEVQRENNSILRCNEDDGSFEAIQFRRVTSELDPQQLIALICFRIDQTTGERIPGTEARVMSREDYPNCASFQDCPVRREDRMVLVRHGDSVARRVDGGDVCERCRCSDGELTSCSASRADADSCSRSDPRDNDTPADCVMDGEEVMHGQRTMKGKCNMCGCRNGELQCTRVPECRSGEDNMNSDDSSSSDSEDDKRCEACMDTPSGPVCARSDGRTFPTSCHALMCQGYEEGDLDMGPCADRDACSMDQRCGEGFACLQLGGETRMSRDSDLADRRRVCVSREQLRCLPTRRDADGVRRVVDEEDDPLEELDGDGDGDDRTICASDGNTYPSTCHMMTESPGRVPRVQYAGRCRPPAPDEVTCMVCGSDGVTYHDVATLRAQGGNVRVDYRGPCDDSESDEDDTPATRCQVVRDVRKICPNITGCTRMVMPSDGCCPMCGSAVVMALDQEALDEHIRHTGTLDNADEFMAGFFRKNSDMEPVISSMAPDRCETTMTRPTTTPGNAVEVMFEARDIVADAAYCHEQAMDMMTRLNSEVTTISTEEFMVAAAIVAPEQVVDPGTDDAETMAASAVVLLTSLLFALSF